MKQIFIFTLVVYSSVTYAMNKALVQIPTKAQAVAAVQNMTPKQAGLALVVCGGVYYGYRAMQHWWNAANIKKAKQAAEQEELYAVDNANSSVQALIEAETKDFSSPLAPGGLEKILRGEQGLY